MTFKLYAEIFSVKSKFALIIAGTFIDGISLSHSTPSQVVAANVANSIVLEAFALQLFATVIVFSVNDVATAVIPVIFPLKG